LEGQAEMHNQPPGYRTAVAALVVVLGLVGTIVMGATVFDASPTQVSAPHTLLDFAEFDGDKTVDPDSFYTDPAPQLNEVAPGTVIRAEPIADAPDGIKATRMVYVSQTVAGANNLVSGYYVTRAGPEPAPNGRPLVAVAHGTTGIAPGCGVSLAPFTPGSTGFGTWDQIVSGLVGAGFAVVATDYANLGTPGVPNYLTMQGGGADVLNSIRAAYTLDREGLDRSKAAILGHSQGGHAALSAATIAPEYAPELSLKGTVAVAPALFPPAPLLKKFIEMAPDEDASYFLAFVSDIVNSWAANYPDQIALDDVFTPQGVAAAQDGLTGCLGATAEAFSGPKKNFVLPELPNVILELSQENFPIYQRYAQPILIQQGLEDTTVVPGVNLAAARTFCLQGSTVNLQTYPEDVHSSVLYTGEADAIRWLNQRFADVAVVSDCEEL
jgi:pimeloyl-ACP methyl ester carboxylesterase